MNSRSIATCANCEQLYCLECSDADDYLRYCSEKCQREHEQEHE